MEATIAIGNHKGGVGKTVTSVNLAARLARLGHRTLLVDVDPQAHATLWFHDGPDFDLHDVLTGKVSTEGAIVDTRIEGLHLLPATLPLAKLEMDIINMTLREFRIKKALERVHSRYDYIVLDLAPSLSAVTVAALVAATHIISPVTPTKLALGAYGTFRGWLTEYQEEFEVVDATLLGVLLTMVDPRTRVARAVRDELRAHNEPMFEAEIPRRINMEDQIGVLVAGEGGGGHGEQDLADAYDAFTAEVLDRVSQGVPQHA
ncbi:MAG: ParA family protein [Actinomycetota bacterium]